MPPEALENGTNISYGKELDVFSFGCVMLHTLSRQWPTPSQAVITDPETGIVTGGLSEIERRGQYFERIAGNKRNVLIPLIKGCLSNLPKNRMSIDEVCDQLGGQLIDRERVSINESTMSTLQQEIQEKDAELQRKANEIQKKDGEIQKKNAEIQRLTSALNDKEVALETPKCDIFKLRIATPHLPPSQVISHSYVNS